MNTRNVFLSPHPDDEALFGSYIIQRTGALIVVVTDGTIHAKKFGIPIEARREESRQAAEILNAKIKFLGIPEENLSFKTMTEAIVRSKIKVNGGFLFVPTRTGGSAHHDLVSDAASEMEGRLGASATLFYGTYSRDNFSPTGEMAIIPTKEEKEIKERALACFVSQHGINKPHFDAVKDVPEFLSFKQ